VCPEAFRERLCTQFGTAVVVTDVITCEIFCDRLRGVDILGDENYPFTLTKPVAVNTRLALPRSLQFLKLTVLGEMS